MFDALASRIYRARLTTAVAEFLERTPHHEFRSRPDAIAAALVELTWDYRPKVFGVPGQRPSLDVAAVVVLTDAAMAWKDDIGKRALTDAGLEAIKPAFAQLRSGRSSVVEEMLITESDGRLVKLMTET